MTGRLRYLAILSTLLVGACSVPEGHIRISLRLPKMLRSTSQSLNSASINPLTQSRVRVLNEETVMRIMINITGTGMAPIVYIWDGHSDTVPEENLTFELPRGADRQIQVLLITKGAPTTSGSCTSFNEADGPMNFWYKKSPFDGNQDGPVEVNLEEQGIAAGAQGRIMGRYINADGTGPTGLVKLYAHIGGDTMVVDAAMIYGGWLNAFLMEGVAFTYEVNGQVLFSGNAIDLANPALAGVGSNSAAAVVSVPVGWRTLYEGGNPCGGYEAVAEKTIQGFFGPGASGKQFCYSTAADTIDRFGTSALSAPINWNGNSSSDPTAAFVASGGLADNDCTNSQDYIDRMDLIVGSLGGSKDESGPFYGPFQKLSFGEIISPMPDSFSGDLKLFWKFLPGTEAGVTGAEVFTFTGSRSNLSFHNLDCGDLTAMGFTSAGVVARSAGTQSITLSGASTDFTSGSLIPLVCPIGADGSYLAAIGKGLEQTIKFGSGFAAVDADDGLIAFGSPYQWQLSFSGGSGGTEKVVSDGAGGYYIAGGFTMVIQGPSTAATSIAHIDASGILDTTFSVTFGNGEYVEDMLFDPTAKRLIIGGFFSTVNGQARSNLAEINADMLSGSYGSPTNWAPSGGGVISLAFGTTYYLYAAGSQIRAFTSTASNTPNGTFAPGTPDVYVFSIAENNGFVYIGGLFSQIGGTSRNKIAALNPTTGALQAWNPGADGAVRGFAFDNTGNYAYVYGDFATMGGQTRNYIAKVGISQSGGNLNTAIVHTDTFDVNGSVFTGHFDGSYFYAGGDFTTAGATARSHLVKFAANGTIQAWDPSPNNRVTSMMMINNGGISELVLLGAFSRVGATY